MFLNGQKFHISDIQYHVHSLFSCRIADVANLKRHQQLDEILIIFTRTIQEISEVVCKKTKHLKKSNAACFYTPIVLKLLIVVQM